MRLSKSIYSVKLACDFSRKWIIEQTHSTKICFSIIFACLTGILAQIKFYMPWTPVPITMQTLAVIGSGLLLGSIYGGLSQLLYVLIGMLGVNWFANGTNGIETIFGPTGGYLFGFIITAIIVGKASEKILYEETKTIQIFLILMIINIIVIYSFGLIQLYVFYEVQLEEKLTIGLLLLKGAIPFIPGDLIKIVGLTMLLEN